MLLSEINPMLSQPNATLTSREIHRAPPFKTTSSAGVSPDIGISMLTPERSLISADTLSDGPSPSSDRTAELSTTCNCRGLLTDERRLRQFVNDCWLTPEACATLPGASPTSSADTAIALKGPEYDARPRFRCRFLANARSIRLRI